MKELPLRDVPLIDLIATFCHIHKCDQRALVGQEFTEVVAALATCGNQNQKIVQASKDIRKYYEVCHFGCHLNRLSAFVAGGYRWEEGQGPYSTGLKVVPITQPDTLH